MLDDRGVGGEKVRNATSHRILRRKSRQTRGHRLSRDHANNSVREKIEAGQHTTRLQIGARMMAKNNLLGDRVRLPLCMELKERRNGTIAALFSKRLWTSDGLASQAGDLAFWDRSTLYGLRGVLQAGETKTGMSYLTKYTHRRLLGDHVPYPVEAWPEGDQRHLSSESGLYCRIFTEGLFGIRPTGLSSFRCTPRLPEGWPRMALRSVRAFNNNFDIVVEARGKNLHLTVNQEGRAVAEHDLAQGESVDVHLQ